jgi:hypothetical protein
MEPVPGPSSSRRREKGVRATRTDYAPILAVVEGAMQRVLADVEATTPHHPTMRLEDGDDWPRSVVCWGFIDSVTGRAIVVRPAEGEERAAALLADEMSEEVSEALARDHRLHSAATWPPCPRHHHSLDPVVVSDHAVWRCRDDAEVEIPIGSLSTLAG